MKPRRGGATVGAQLTGLKRGGGGGGYGGARQKPRGGDASGRRTPGNWGRKSGTNKQTWGKKYKANPRRSGRGASKPGMARGAENQTMAQAKRTPRRTNMRERYGGRG